MSAPDTERLSVTQRTHSLLESFEQSAQRVEQIKRELNRAECQLSNDQTALAKWLIPKGAKTGEQFNIWYGNRIVSVVAGSERVSIREARAGE